MLTLLLQHTRLPGSASSPDVPPQLCISHEGQPRAATRTERPSPHLLHPGGKVRVVSRMHQGDGC